jgi:hypothetical protein
VFWAGISTARNASAVVALPDRRSLAAVADGTAYRVCANDPEDWGELSLPVIAEPVVVEALELVIFVSYTSMLGYGRDGCACETEPLAWDDLEVVRVEGEILHAKGFDAPLNAIVPFTLDLQTGTSQNAPHPKRRLRPLD